jgi:hypothetical protein
MVLWWIPAGTIPTVDEALARLRTLAEDGPGPEAFGFKSTFPAPDSAGEPAADAAPTTEATA